MRLGQSGCRGWWHSLGIVVTATALATGSAAAPGGPVPEPAARAAQPGEDLLLLEALR